MLVSGVIHGFAPAALCLQHLAKLWTDLRDHCTQEKQLGDTPFTNSETGSDSINDSSGVYPSTTTDSLLPPTAGPE
jgi:hypothetical protein